MSKFRQIRRFSVEVRERFIAVVAFPPETLIAAARRAGLGARCLRQEIRYVFAYAFDTDDGAAGVPGETRVEEPGWAVSLRGCKSHARHGITAASLTADATCYPNRPLPITAAAILTNAMVRGHKNKRDKPPPSFTDLARQGIGCAGFVLSGSDSLSRPRPCP